MNYLKQGKALFRSLCDSSSENFILYYLCMDKETYEAVIEYDSRIIPVLLDELEDGNEKLASFKDFSPYNAFCWSLASTFCLYLLEEKNVESIMYIDSDIYFYQDIKLVYDEIGDKSVGIIRHRHNTSLSVDGEYNVGRNWSETH